MSYCKLQDLIDRFGEIELIELSDNDNVGQINEDTIDSAIEDADGLINGYVGSRFPVPLSPVPSSINRIACELARYYLYDDGAPDYVTKRFDDAEKVLKGISKGEISIGITEQGEKPSSQNTVQMTSGGNVFNRKDKSFL